MKLVLNNHDVADGFFEDAILLGIQCSLLPEKFIWMINRHFGYSFRYQQLSEVRLMRQSRQFVYPIFSCKERNLSLVHFIYTNQYDGEYLLPELRHTDFLWLLKNEGSDEGFALLLAEELRKLDAVQLVTQLANDKIKNKQHLVL